MPLRSILVNCTTLSIRNNTLTIYRLPNILDVHRSALGLSVKGFELFILVQLLGLFFEVWVAFGVAQSLPVGTPDRRCIVVRESSFSRLVQTVSGSPWCIVVPGLVLESIIVTYWGSNRITLRLLDIQLIFNLTIDWSGMFSIAIFSTMLIYELIIDFGTKIGSFSFGAQSINSRQLDSVEFWFWTLL